MSDDATENYLHERIVDGLTSAGDAAIGMGYGNRRESDAVLHTKFIKAMQQAEGAARGIAHARGERGQGIAWVRLAGKIHVMHQTAAEAVGLTIANALTQDPRTGRGALWIRLGELLTMLAQDCEKATERRSSDALVVGGVEYLN